MKDPPRTPRLCMLCMPTPWSFCSPKVKLWSLATHFILVTLPFSPPLIDVKLKGGSRQGKTERGPEPWAPRQSLLSGTAAPGFRYSSCAEVSTQAPQSTGASEMEKFVKLGERKVGLLVGL